MVISLVYARVCTVRPGEPLIPSALPYLELTTADILG
jgi:hypothetical protein